MSDCRSALKNLGPGPWHGLWILNEAQIRRMDLSSLSTDLLHVNERVHAPTTFWILLLGNHEGDLMQDLTNKI